MDSTGLNDIVDTPESRFSIQVLFSVVIFRNACTDNKYLFYSRRNWAGQLALSAVAELIHLCRLAANVNLTEYSSSEGESKAAN